MIETNGRPQGKPYHHGNLRAALIEAGLKLLEARTADDLGLREVARQVGVSATSVYRHFPDKKALMSALAKEGFERLASAQLKARGPSGSIGTASSVAYVRFARDNPALFRLMCANSGEGRLPGSEPRGHLSPPASVGFPSAACSGDDAGIVALRTWATAHGVAMLILDGQARVDCATLSRIFDVTASSQ